MNRTARYANIVRALAVVALGGLPAAADAATSTLTGVIEIKATITINKTVPANTVITAQGYVSMSDTVTGSHNVSDYVTLKNWSPGQTVTVTISLPYTWDIGGSGDQMSVSVNIYTNNAALPSAGAGVEMSVPTTSPTTVAFPAAI